MAEVLENLTADERAVLEICSQQGCVAEIGRWEAPVLSLERKGYLAGPQFNKGLTDAGRRAAQAMAADEDRQVGKMYEAAQRVAVAQQEIAQLVEQAAALMATAAIKTHEVRGDSAGFALQQWTKQMVQEAQNRLREAGHA